MNWSKSMFLNKLFRRPTMVHLKDGFFNSFQPGLRLDDVDFGARMGLEASFHIDHESWSEGLDSQIHGVEADWWEHRLTKEGAEW